MTEVVLLFPIFMVIVFITAKMFALLVLVQKLEIGSYYASRRWQLESHLNSDYVTGGAHGCPDFGCLDRDILDKVKTYMGFYDPSVKSFLNLDNITLEIVPTQVWNVVTIKVATRPGLEYTKLFCRGEDKVCKGFGADCRSGYKYLCSGSRTLEVTKYVPNRDRPIQFVLPGLK